VANTFCAICPHHDQDTGDCALIVANRFGELAAGQPCNLAVSVRHVADVLLRRRAPAERDLAGDLSQDLLGKICDPSQVIPGARLRSWPRLIAYLRKCLERRLINALLRRRVLVRSRCGNCRHFVKGHGSTAPRCGLAFIRSNGQVHANPHGVPGSVQYQTDPRRLTPRCEAFSRRTGRELVSLAGNEPEEPSSWPPARDEIQDRLERALVSLMTVAPRAAMAVRKHHLEGRPIEAIAVELGVHRRTVQRDLGRALRLLRRFVRG